MISRSLGEQVSKFPVIREDYLGDSSAADFGKFGHPGLGALTIASIVTIQHIGRGRIANLLSVFTIIGGNDIGFL
jgi:hypothetical protein